MIQGQINVDDSPRTVYTATKTGSEFAMNTYEFEVAGYRFNGDPFWYKWTEEVSMLSDSPWELTTIVMNCVKKMLTGVAV